VISIQRTELLNQSLGGNYELELELDSNVHVERIKRVQILIGMWYSTRMPS
jgi:hypothetical protein